MKLKTLAVAAMLLTVLPAFALLQLARVILIHIMQLVSLWERLWLVPGTPNLLRALQVTMSASQTWNSDNKKLYNKCKINSLLLILHLLCINSVV